MRYWLDALKKGRLFEPRPPTTRAPVCMGGSGPRFVFIQQLMGNFIVICDIFDLFGNIVSKQRINKLDFLSTQMSVIFRNLRLQCLPASLNQFPVGCS